MDSNGAKEEISPDLSDKIQNSLNVIHKRLCKKLCYSRNLILLADSK
jgi:hypothetical protein